ncbi:serine/threonine-protein kinase [Luteimonas aquatica]|uniref:serine/threonine-protein kinase n=1 Tax=Luteimonas aquatica TaxID=450364 RepID=UPI001F5706E2|nr:serine/threonine-protein kinase [Luteimonas aquatica]
MTPGQLERVEACFHAAVRQPPERRAAFLAAMEADAEVRTEAARLLRCADDETGEDAMPEDPLARRLQRLLAQEAPARRIGRYRLLREIGAGGMGSVFLAERDVDGMPQRVALKLLHGIATEAGKRRMARERALLAGLNHPQIAKHLDGGDTEQGQPFLVMDYVEGLPLPEYVAARAPSRRQRLELFLALCAAVQHAHQRLILHRDIKPSNVIVREDGTPVLLDFGVGKLIEEADNGATVTIAFTPGYGAPEQRRGDAATTATDVFGLGAVLFDLLADTKLSAVRKGAAPVPAPGAHAPGRRRLLSGDLDRIVLKACAEAPEDRYATVLALADDVAAHLAGRPLAAASGTLHRARRFVLRHRWACLAACAAFVAAGAFVWRLDVERQRARAAEAAAEREAEYARASRNFLASVLASSDPAVARGSPLTTASLLAAATQRLARHPPPDRAMRVIAWLTVAEVYASLNDPQPGLRAADAAMALLDARQGAREDELRIRALRVRGLLLGQLNRHGQARSAMRKMLDLRARGPDDPAGMARSYQDYAMVAAAAGDEAEADRAVRRGLRVLDRAGIGDSPERASLLSGRSSLSSWKQDKALALRDAGRAEDAARAAALPPEDPLWVALLMDAARSRRTGGPGSRQGLAYAERALALSYRLYGQDSKTTADAENLLAALLRDVGRLPEAIAHYRQSRAISTRLGLGAVHLARLDSATAAAYDVLRDHPRIVALLDAAIPHLPDGPRDIDRAVLRRAYLRRASSLRQLQRYAESERDYRTAMRMIAGEHGGDSPAYAEALNAYVLLLVDRGRYAEAERTLDRVRAILDAHPADAGVALRMWVACSGAMLARARGDLDAAQARAEEALRLGGRDPVINAVELARVQVLAAEIAMRRNQAHRAQALLDKAAPQVERLEIGDRDWQWARRAIGAAKNGCGTAQGAS